MEKDQQNPAALTNEQRAKTAYSSDLMVAANKRLQALFTHFVYGQKELLKKAVVFTLGSLLVKKGAILWGSGL